MFTSRLNGVGEVVVVTPGQSVAELQALVKKYYDQYYNEYYNIIYNDLLEQYKVAGFGQKGYPGIPYDEIRKQAKQLAIQYTIPMVQQKEQELRQEEQVRQQQEIYNVAMQRGTAIQAKRVEAISFVMPTDVKSVTAGGSLVKEVGPPVIKTFPVVPKIK